MRPAHPVIPSLAVLLITLAGGPVLARPAQQMDLEATPTVGDPPAPAALVEQKKSSTWEFGIEAHAGYGGVASLSASAGGVQVHGLAAGGAIAVTWALSRSFHGGIRLGGIVACAPELGQAWRHPPSQCCATGADTATEESPHLPRQPRLDKLTPTSYQPRRSPPRVGRNKLLPDAFTDET